MRRASKSFFQAPLSKAARPASFPPLNHIFLSSPSAKIAPGESPRPLLIALRRVVLPFDLALADLDLPVFPSFSSLAPLSCRSFPRHTISRPTRLRSRRLPPLPPSHPPLSPPDPFQHGHLWSSESRHTDLLHRRRHAVPEFASGEYMRFLLDPPKTTRSFYSFMLTCSSCCRSTCSPSSPTLVFCFSGEP